MTYLKSEHITLRAIEPEDLEIFYRWENDTSLWNIGSAVEPYSRFLLKKYIAQAEQTIYEKRQLRLMIVRNSDQKPIGAIDLYDFEPHHSRADIGVLIDKIFQQQGFASETLKLITDYAFNFLNINQLYAQIPSTNKACQKLFAKNNFEKSATLRRWLRHGNEFIDVEIWQLFKC